MSVDLTIDGAVAKVVLNRPEKLNALSVEMRESLCDYFARLRFNDAVRVVIVTGAGRGFCSGADVDRMAGQPHDLRADRERMQRGGHTFIRALHAIEKPVIAAVRGPAVGIGWSIALACDLVVASKTARFSQIFRRIGLAPDGGAIWFLTRRIGMAKAKELVFSARFVEAEEALTLGLVNHVVEDDELMAKTEALAADLAEAPTFALGLAKKLFHAAAGPSLESYLEIESLVQPQLHMTVDNAEESRRSGRSASRSSSGADPANRLSAHLIAHHSCCKRGHHQRETEEQHVDADQEADRPIGRARPAVPDQEGQQQIDDPTEQQHPAPAPEVRAVLQREDDRGDALEDKERDQYHRQRQHTRQRSKDQDQAEHDCEQCGQ